MAIRLAHNCAHCDHLMSDDMCKKHGVEVDANYTCDQFSMKAEFSDHRDCTTCVRFETDDCENPTKAAAGMMCSAWAPKDVA